MGQLGLSAVHLGVWGGEWPPARPVPAGRGAHMWCSRQDAYVTVATAHRSRWSIPPVAPLSDASSCPTARSTLHQLGAGSVRIGAGRRGDGTRGRPRCGVVPRNRWLHRSRDPWQCSSRRSTRSRLLHRPSSVTVQLLDCVDVRPCVVQADLDRERPSRPPLRAALIHRRGARADAARCRNQFEGRIVAVLLDIIEKSDDVPQGVDERPCSPGRRKIGVRTSDRSRT